MINKYQKWVLKHEFELLLASMSDGDTKARWERDETRYTCGWNGLHVYQQMMNKAQHSLVQ